MINSPSAVDAHKLPEVTLLVPKAVAIMLGINTRTLAVWRSDRRYPLPYVKIGSRVRYRVCDVEAFIEARTVK
ncbi:MAG: helix-turn-helix domain-containing protein [Gammaproteobacteria bacterium]|nr:helix-turn-helix domain-containing protein [Gammaproteobacteria bacterium]